MEIHPLVWDHSVVLPNTILIENFTDVPSHSGSENKPNVVDNRRLDQCLNLLITKI